MPRQDQNKGGRGAGSGDTALSLFLWAQWRPLGCRGAGRKGGRDRHTEREREEKLVAFRLYFINNTRCLLLQASRSVLCPARARPPAHPPAVQWPSINLHTICLPAAACWPNRGLNGWGQNAKNPKTRNCHNNPLFLTDLELSANVIFLQITPSVAVLLL